MTAFAMSERAAALGPGLLQKAIFEFRTVESG